MKIYIDLTPADFITLFGLGFLLTVVFLIIGIMLVVTKNTNLLSKTKTFKNPKLFTTLSGWIYIVFSILIGIVLAIAYINKDLHLTMFLLLAILVLTMLLTELFLQKKFEIKK